MTKDVLLGPSLANASDPLTNPCCFSSSCHRSAAVEVSQSAKASACAKPSAFGGPSSVVISTLDAMSSKQRGQTVPLLGLLKWGLGFYSLSSCIELFNPLLMSLSVLLNGTEPLIEHVIFRVLL